MHIFKTITTAAILSATAITAAAQQPPMTVTASTDSTALVMGDRTTVTVEVVKNAHEGVLVDIPETGKDYHGMEVVDITADSADLGNNRIQLNYRLTFQAFDPSDVLTLPPFRYASRNDTASSDILTFKVMPVELSPELGDPAQPDSLKIHPDHGVVSVKSKWYDAIPDWTIWILVAIVILALAYVLYRLYRKNGPSLFVPRKPVPPYELAIQRLNALKAKKLIEHGEAKQFFTEVTDIWRQYLEGRFGISAMEMTSRQILQELRDNKETHLTADQMADLLSVSDFVKFAAMSPTNDEMVRTFNTIHSFVESTRPQPEPEEKNQITPINTRLTHSK